MTRPGVHPGIRHALTSKETIRAAGKVWLAVLTAVVVAVLLRGENTRGKIVQIGGRATYVTQIIRRGDVPCIAPSSAACVLQARRLVVTCLHDYLCSHTFPPPQRGPRGPAGPPGPSGSVGSRGPVGVPGRRGVTRIIIQRPRPVPPRTHTPAVLAPPTLTTPPPVLNPAGHAPPGQQPGANPGHGGCPPGQAKKGAC